MGRAKVKPAPVKAIAFTGIDAFLDAMWANVREPDVVEKSYEKAAKDDATIARALARYRCVFDEDTRDMIKTAVTAFGTGKLLAPIVAAQLWRDDYTRYAAVRVLAEWLHEPRALPVLREALALAKDKEWKESVWGAIVAAGGDVEEAKPHLTSVSWLAVVLARRGDADAQRLFADEVDAFIASFAKERHTSSSFFEEPFRIMRRIGELRMVAAVPALVRALETPATMHAMIALARIVDFRGGEIATRLLGEIRGPDHDRSWAYLLPSQWLRAALGDRVDPTAARAALGELRPQRYGWPKTEDVALLEGCAGEVLVRAGTESDRELLCAWITRSDPWHREIARAAHAALGRGVPALEYWDPGRIATSSAEELRAALAAPTTVFRTHVAEALAAKKDDAAIAWAVDRLESVENFYLEPDHADEAEMDATSATALAIARTHRKHARVRDSSSAWIKSLLTEQPMTYPDRAPAGRELTARRLDAAPFVFGKQINGMALDPAGARLAVVGDELGTIVDASSGDVLVRLKLRWRWAYDCAWSPDGTLLAVAYHGGHLVVFDGATGEERQMLVGFGGVPDGVRKCAWSPGGTHLAATGSDGRAIIFAWPSGEAVWSAKGKSFEAIHWSSDGATCTIAHVSKKRADPDYLLVVDVAKKKARKHETPGSVWSIVELPDGTFLAGGEKKLLVLDAKRVPTTMKLAQDKVTRLARLGDTAVLAASDTGVLTRWELGGKKPAAKPVITEGTALWAMAVRADGTTFVGGSSGIVWRFTAEGAPIERTGGEVHTRQVRGFAPLSDGTVVTASWDGRVLRWPAGFGGAVVVATFDGRAPEITCRPDRACAYVGIPGGVLVVPAQGEPRTIELGKGEDVEAIACDGELLVVATEKHRIVAFREADLSEAWAIKCADVSALCFRGGAIVAGNEHGTLLGLDRSGGEQWRRREHRDLVDKLPNGNPHCTVVGLASHGGDRWASASNDDSLRLFDRDERKRRFLVDSGLFNGIAFSPSGRLLALASSHAFQLFDAERGEHLAMLPVRMFPGADELTRPCFLDETRVLVGAENGAIFEVTG